jgi:hypothetical protein
VRDLTGGCACPTDGSTGTNAILAVRRVGRSERQHAVTLAGQEVHAEQAGTTAMASGDWLAAADLEEERVARQDELAQPLLSRRP